MDNNENLVKLNNLPEAEFIVVFFNPNNVVSFNKSKSDPKPETEEPDD